jgi:molybdopterin-guanine dinucleotide biosynthesis protein A
MSTRILGAILAGGSGSRMGSAVKALLERSPGQSLLGHLLSELVQVPLEGIVVLANAPEPFRRFARPVIPDRRPGLGPLAGIEAALEHAGAGGFDGVLVLPCDLPALTAREIARLATAFRDDPRGIATASVGPGPMDLHPLCCVVHRDLLPEIRAAINDRRLAVGSLWRSLGAKPVPFDDPAPFRNVNSPADLQAWNREQNP